VRALKEELAAAGIRSKLRLLANGTPFGGQKLSRGALYLMLQNRIYRGEITHRGNTYPGEHQPIVDEALWNQVQATLAKNRVDRAVGSSAKQPSLLAGLIFDETGERLTPSHAVKKRHALSILRLEISHRRHSQGHVKRTAYPSGQSREPGDQ
jgi:site-specific DNA recombinase